MVLLDKSASVGAARTQARRHRCRAYVRKQKIKSIPRTRKEKCQTAGFGERIWALRSHQNQGAHRLKFCLGPISFCFNCRRLASRLTFLTPLCQKCQMNWRNFCRRCCRDPPRHHPTMEPAKDSRE